MDAGEREQRVTALTAELGHLADDLAEQAANVRAAQAAGDAEGLLDAAEVMVRMVRSLDHFTVAYRSLLAVRLPPGSSYVGHEMSDL
jgi:hypothetical protein